MFFLLLLCSRLCLAQQPRFKHFGVAEGLPGSETYNLYQDKKGYIWVFTAYGIVKYNGAGFVSVCTNLEFQESIIYALNESPDGILYFSNANNTIYQVRNDSAFLVKGGRQLAQKLHPGYFIKNIAVDSNKNIYLQETNHFCFRLSAQGVLTDFNAGKPGYQNVYTYISNNDFVRSFNPSNYPLGRFIRLEEEKTVTIVPLSLSVIKYNSSIAKRNKNGVYINGWKDMVYSDRTTRPPVVLKLDGIITKYKFTADGHVWIGTHSSGLYETDKDLHVLNHYLDGLSVSDILQDKEQGLWISTLEQGVFYWKNRQEKHYNNITSFSGWVTMLKKIGDKLFFGTYEGSLFEIKNDTVTAIGKLKDSPPVVHDIARISDRYLIATMNGVYTMDTFYRNLRPIGTKTYKISLSYSYQLLLKKADSFYSVSGDAISLWQKDHVVFSQYIPEKARCIIVRSNGQILLGTHVGVFEYSRLHLQPVIYLNVIKGKVVHRMKEDQRHVIWILTKGEGIYRLFPDNTIDSISNLPSSFVNDVYFTEDSSVLVATNKGLFINACNDVKTKTWRQLFFDECIEVVVYNGKIFIATKEGLVSLQNPSVHKKYTIPVYLSSAIINGRKVNELPPELPHQQNDIYFNFDFLNYSFPVKEFEYKLDGPYKDSAVIKGTQLHLQNLTPGAYTLDIHLPNLPGSYDERPFQLHFYIRPAFWQTRIFLVAVTILVIIFAYTTGRLLQIRVRKTERKKAYINNLLSEYKITALKAQVNPHFISNSLAAIQQLILANEVDKAGLYMARFSLFIRYVLKYSDQALAKLSEELKIIDLNIELEQLRFSNRFVFEKQLDADIDPDEIWIPPMITQPFIENAIWHGILPLKEQRTGKLVLKITQQNGSLIISIIDNGVGRNKNADHNDYDIKESKGTWLITQRLENMNQIYPGTNSRIQIHDLLDEKLQPAGTQIDIIMPYDLHERNRL